MKFGGKIGQILQLSQSTITFGQFFMLHDHFKFPGFPVSVGTLVVLWCEFCVFTGLEVYEFYNEFQFQTYYISDYILSCTRALAKCVMGFKGLVINYREGGLQNGRWEHKAC